MPFFMCVHFHPLSCENPTVGTNGSCALVRVCHVIRSFDPLARMQLTKSVEPRAWGL